MIVARSTGGDAPTSSAYATTATTDNASARRRPTIHASANVTNADTSTTFSPDTTTRCDVFVAFRSPLTSRGSADRWPRSTPCASDACGSGSESASACERRRRIASVSPVSGASSSCPIRRAAGYCIVLWIPRRSRYAA